MSRLVKRFGDLFPKSFHFNNIYEDSDFYMNAILSAQSYMYSILVLYHR